MSATAFWWRYARAPLLLFLVGATLLEITGADLKIAHVLFFDPTQMHWRGADSGWTNELLHHGGASLVRGLGLAALGLWIATWLNERLLGWRRPAAYFLVSMALTIGIVGLLKHFTNVNCPWDLQAFGGRFPYVPLFADRPDALPAAHCFPAAHAGSGYALLTLYFIGREHDVRWARRGLIVGLLTGCVFGLAQQSRGAHFLSHDLYSAWLGWCIPLSVYCFGFRCRVWRRVATAVPATPSFITMP